LRRGLVHATEKQIVKADDMDAEAPLHNDVYDALGVSGKDRGEETHHHA
jgi:hypothetical protein